MKSKRRATIPLYDESSARLKSRPVRKRNPEQPSLPFDPMPDRVEPCLALLRPAAPEGPDWLFELKWDGYRLAIQVEAGAPLFRLDASEQKAALETARRQIAEIDAQSKVDQTELVGADAQILEARSAYEMAVDEYEMKAQLLKSNAVSRREVERLETGIEGRKSALDAVLAKKKTLETQISTLLPAQKASAEAALAQAQVELDKTTVRAGVTGTVQQFVLRPGDVVNAMLRPAGILVPENAGRTTHDAYRRLRTDRGAGDEAGNDR